MVCAVIRSAGELIKLCIFSDAVAHLQRTVVVVEILARIVVAIDIIGLSRHRDISRDFHCGFCNFVESKRVRHAPSRPGAWVAVPAVAVAVR